MGRFEDAIAMWQRDLEICQTTPGVGDNHLDTAVTYNNMGVSYSTMGRKVRRARRAGGGRGVGATPLLPSPPSFLSRLRWHLCGTPRSTRPRPRARGASGAR